jgi:hypothetical protein
MDGGFVGNEQNASQEVGFSLDASSRARFNCAILVAVSLKIVRAIAFSDATADFCTPDSRRAGHGRVWTNPDTDLDLSACSIEGIASNAGRRWIPRKSRTGGAGGI